MSEVNIDQIIKNWNLNNVKDTLKNFHDTQAKYISPSGGWHNMNDIETLKGLEGQFHWYENIFNLSIIRFKFTEGKEGSEGTYQMQGMVSEEGLFQCVPNNPAIGYAFISLMPNIKHTPRPFIISGMFTDSNWKIFTMLLNKVGESGPMYPPFSAIRVGM